MRVRGLLSLLLVPLAPTCLCCPPPRPALQGRVLKGTEPFSDARIYLLSPPEPAGVDMIATSLIPDDVGTLDTGLTALKGFRYISSDAAGRFSLFPALRCTAGQQIYAYAVDSVNRSAAAELAILGSCPPQGSLAGTYSRIVINEVTTVAAAYAMAHHALDPVHFQNQGRVGEQALLAKDFASAVNAIDLQTGEAHPSGFLLKVHTLANALHACDTHSSQEKVSDACVQLFTILSDRGRVDGTVDTASAAIAIAKNTTGHTHSLFLLAQVSSVFQPALTAEPQDFNFSLDEEPPK